MRLLMDKPQIADTKPIKVKLNKDEEYLFCNCGKSNNQPFCDWSHVGSPLEPIKFKAEDSGDAFLCMCKHSKNKPYCDGTHKNLSNNKNISEKKLSTIPSNTPEEPYIEHIHELANNGLSNLGHHGEMGAMGVPFHQLPQWEDIQILTAQLYKKPLLDEDNVQSEVVIGRNADKPLTLKIPLFISDMSFGALSEEAKISLSKGAELVGTGICSGEGGMLPEEQEFNSRYFYELASAKFGYSENLLSKVQAFHFKGGQAAKTGTGGHLPANKVKGKIAQVRNIPEGTEAISPSTFQDLNTIEDYRRFADLVRNKSKGIPIGFKISAQHIEEDIEFAAQASADYIILDGRGGGTGAAPLIFRDNISVPTIPALARARNYLDQKNYKNISLIITGGLRTASDFVKAIALGADAIAISNSAMQAIGCVGARMCNTNNCPAGIATQKPELRKKLNIDNASKKLSNYLSASTELMKTLARACGHHHLSQFNINDLSTWKLEMSKLSGIKFCGIKP